jgi:hypothetical protein
MENWLSSIFFKISASDACNMLMKLWPKRIEIGTNSPSKRDINITHMDFAAAHLDR